MSISLILDRNDAGWDGCEMLLVTLMVQFDKFRKDTGKVGWDVGKDSTVRWYWKLDDVQACFVSLYWYPQGYRKAYHLPIGRLPLCAVSH